MSILSAVTAASLDDCCACSVLILFGRNIESASQLRKLIDDLRDLSEIEPIITIDQEGGRVSRLRLIGNEPPNAPQLRDKDDVDLIRRHGDITGRLLRLFGFNLDLCPVLDISFDDNADNSLHGRCYGKTVEQVVRNAGMFNHAMREQGITSCGKHFPGYSAATVDAHHDLPKIERTREELDREELAVFRAFIGRDGALRRPQTVDATPARSTTQCESRGSRAAVNIFPVTPRQPSMRITICQRLSVHARSWTAKSSLSFAVQLLAC